MAADKSKEIKKLMEDLVKRQKETEKMMKDASKLMQAQAEMQDQKKILDMLQKTNKSQHDMMMKVVSNLKS
jgi:hypothetical protein